MKQISSGKTNIWYLWYVICLTITITTLVMSEEAQINQETVPATAVQAIAVAEDKAPPTTTEISTVPDDSVKVIAVESDVSSTIETVLPPAAENVNQPLTVPDTTPTSETPTSETVTSETVTSETPTSETQITSPEQAASAPALLTPEIKAPGGDEELSSLRADLVKTVRERDETLRQLSELRADVNVIRQDQAATNTRATELETDLQAARTRIGILEKNAWERTRLDLELETKWHEALNAASHCGENLAGSERRARAANVRVELLEPEINNLMKNVTDLKEQLGQKEAALNNFSAQLQERETTLTTTQHQLTEQTVTLAKVHEQLQECITVVMAREASISKFQEQLQEYTATISARAAQIQVLSTNLNTVTQELHDTQTNLATLTAQHTELQTNLATLTTQHIELQTNLTTLTTQHTELQAHYEKTAQDLLDEQMRYTTLENKYGQLTAIMAPMDGGTLDSKIAQTQAKEAYEHYRTLWKKSLRMPRDMDLLNLVQQARRHLFVTQYQVLRVNGGGELYMVRPNDTYAIIARLALGDNQRGDDIRKANAHLPPEGSLLIGTPLIVPDLGKN